MIEKFEILEISIVKVQNVSDIEVAKRMSQDDQNFIELEDAPLKRKLTNPMPPGSYYTKPKKSNEMIAAGGGHASPNLLPSQFGDLSIEFGGPPQFGGINKPFGGARAKRPYGSSGYSGYPYNT